MSTELTESEAERIGDAYDVGPASVIKVVTRIVKAREAAARREAEDDPAHARMYRALVERAERAEAEVATARREALLETRGEVQRRMDAAESADGGKLQTRDALAGVMEWIESALAEPERDEEGGR